MSSSPTPIRQGAVQGSLAVALGEGIALPLAVLTAGVLTRSLGPEAYGRFTMAAMLVTTLQWLLIAILANVVVRFVAEATDWRPVAATAYRAYLVAGLTLGAALWALSGPIATLLKDPLMGPHLRLFSVEVPLFALFLACRNVLAGTGRYRQQALMGASRWIGRAILIVLFIQMGWAVRGAILGSIGGALIAWIIGQAFVGGAAWGRGGSPLRRLVNLAVPVFLLMLSARLFDQFGLLMLYAILGSGPQTGYYGAAQNVSMVTGVVAPTVVPILISTLGAAIRDGDEAGARLIVDRTVRATVALFAFAGIVTGSAAEIVVLLFGADFTAAAPLLAWLVFVAVCLISISVNIGLLTVRGRPLVAAALAAPLLPLSLLAHSLLIPRLGALGAAIVTTGTALLAAAACTAVSLRAWKVRLPAATMLRCVAIGAGAYLVAAAISTPGVLVVGKVAVLSLLVVVGFVATGELGGAELADLRALAGRGKRR